MGKKRKHTQAQDADDAATESRPNKHAKIFSKFEKSKKVSQLVAAKQKSKKQAEEHKLEETSTPVVAQGLEPLPQPAPAPDSTEKPSYSVLPDWLTKPITETTSDTQKTFSNLVKDPDLLARLERNGYTTPSAVQAAVIPLLMNRRHGDVCVSASTGSGKTLSYVVPLLELLEKLEWPQLRAVIVVPTRELVKQVRAVFDQVGGGKLRIGTAVGNEALRDEQRKLMKLHAVYDPKAYEKQQKKIMTAEEWARFGLLDYFAECETTRDLPPGYVNEPYHNVDVLICTPGRLVDHIRLTRGFSLRNVQYLVVDEADRLLNESFQEWVSVVMKSLDERKDPASLGSGGNFLASIGHQVEVPEVRKVILSATLTTDLSKLQSLRLNNPRLVKTGSQTEQPGESEPAQSGERFVLPDKLREHAVRIKDASQKPLQLLQLLLDEIKVDGHGSVLSQQKNSDHDSSDDSESSDSASESSYGSDYTSSSDDSDVPESDDSSVSDSDSDSDSDSSAESSSSDESASDSEQSTAPTSKESARNTVLVFTRSSESAARLSRVLQLMQHSSGLKDRIGTLIKSHGSSASRRTLRDYRRGRLSIIIATDRAARGLDLRSLRHVVNYDMPTSATTYVHRVGRTARAGQDGSAWTFVQHREGRWFAREVIGRSSEKKQGEGATATIVRAAPVQNVMLTKPSRAMREDYETALAALAEEVNNPN